jgi:hypothetical protein
MIAWSAGSVPADETMMVLPIHISQHIRVLHQVLFAAFVLTFFTGLVGCQPEMPQPPRRQSTNPAEDGFYSMIDRMNHAMEMFRPSSGLGLHVKRTLTHKLNPPGEGRPNYTATITLSTSSMFDHGKIPTAQERQKAKDDKTREVAKEIGLADPFGPMDEDPATVDPMAIPEPGSATLNEKEVVDPLIPAQKITEKKEYRLEYIENQWKLLNDKLEDHEKMWFDYALQQGEFGPNP